MKTLSQMLQEIEPVNDKFLRETFGDNNKYAFVDRASYDRMKQVATELSQTLEAIFNSTTHPTTVVFIGDSLSRAKDIIGGEK